MAAQVFPRAGLPMILKNFASRATWPEFRSWLVNAALKSGDCAALAISGTVFKIVINIVERSLKSR